MTGEGEEGGIIMYVVDISLAALQNTVAAED
jgi:hypothetical protein